MMIILYENHLFGRILNEVDNIHCGTGESYYSSFLSTFQTYRFFNLFYHCPTDLKVVYANLKE